MIFSFSTFIFLGLICSLILIFSSPSGQQFVSCREVSSYLQSLFGHGDAQLQISHRSENMLQEHRATIENVSHHVAAIDLL